MTRIGMLAIVAALGMGACAPVEVTSRMETSGTLFGAFDARESYRPEVIGSRAENDMMRFSTMSLAH